MPNSWQLHGLQLARLLCPWDFLSKNTGVGCHFLLQGIFLTQGLNPCLLHWQVGSLPLCHPRSPGGLHTVQAKISETASGLGQGSLLPPLSQHLSSLKHLFSSCLRRLISGVKWPPYFMFFSFFFSALGSSCHLFKNLQLRVLKLL